MAKKDKREQQVITCMLHAYIAVNSEEAATDEEKAEKEKRIDASAKRLDTLHIAVINTHIRNMEAM